MDKPDLWSPDNPYLYKVRSTVRDKSGVVDVYETPFGIREAVFDVDKGFLLNGKQVKLNGVCLHDEAASVGAAVPERVWERRLEKLEGDGLQLHSDLSQSSRAGIHGPVRQIGLHGDE